MKNMRKEIILREVADIINDMRLSRDPEYVDTRIRIGDNLYMTVSCNRGYGVGVRRSGCVSTRNKHTMFEDRYIDMDIATQRDYYYNFESPFSVSLKEERMMLEGYRAKGFTVTVRRGKFVLGETKLSHNMKEDITDVLFSCGIN